MNLHDAMRSDAARVFLNPDEFAEEITIEGVPTLAVCDWSTNPGGEPGGDHLYGNPGDTWGVNAVHADIKLRRDGKTFHSYGTPTGSDGTGSTPFLARTSGGNLRVMYRRNPGHVDEGEDDVFLAYAPPIQYHAVAPHVEEAARETSMRIFHKELNRAVDDILAGRAVS